MYRLKPTMQLSAYKGDIAQQQIDMAMRCAANIAVYELFWQPALVRYSSILYLCLLIGQIKMLACLLIVTHCVIIVITHFVFKN